MTRALTLVALVALSLSGCWTVTTHVTVKTAPGDDTCHERKTGVYPIYHPCTEEERRAGLCT